MHLNPLVLSFACHNIRGAGEPGARRHQPHDPAHAHVPKYGSGIPGGGSPLYINDIAWSDIVTRPPRVDGDAARLVLCDVEIVAIPVHYRSPHTYRISELQLSGFQRKDLPKVRKWLARLGLTNPASAAEEQVYDQRSGREDTSDLVECHVPDIGKGELYL
jgi:hypothetical protein